LKEIQLFLTSLVFGIDFRERDDIVEFALGGVLPAISGGSHGMKEWSGDE